MSILFLNFLLGLCISNKLLHLRKHIFDILIINLKSIGGEKGNLEVICILSFLFYVECE